MLALLGRLLSSSLADLFGLEAVVHGLASGSLLLFGGDLLVLEVRLYLALAGRPLGTTLLFRELGFLSKSLVVDRENLSSGFALASGDCDGDGVFDHEGRHVLGGDCGPVLARRSWSEVEIAQTVKLIEKTPH